MPLTDKQISEIDSLMEENNRLIVRDGMPPTPTKEEFARMSRQIQAYKNSNGTLSEKDLEKIT